MADHQGAAAPAFQQGADGVAAIGVEVVGRLVQHQHVRRVDQQPGQGQAGGLAAAQRAERPAQVEIGGQAQLGQRRGRPLLHRPVGGGEVLLVALPRQQPVEPGQGRGDAERVGGGHAGHDPDGLGQQADAALAQDPAGLRRDLAQQQAQQRRLADAVAADEARPLRPEGERQVLEQRAMVRGVVGQRLGGKERHGGSTEAA